MPVIPAAAMALIRNAIMRLNGPALSAFIKEASGRLGISLGGTASTVAGRVMQYVSSNALSAGLVAGSLAVSTIDFDIDEFIDAWSKEGSVPDDVSYVMKQITQLREQRESILGDGDDDTVMGLDVKDLKRANRSLMIIDHQVETLINHFGSLEDVISIRNALFSLDDASFAIYKERHNA